MIPSVQTQPTAVAACGSCSWRVRARRGLTLVEILLAVAVVIILATLVMGGVGQVRYRAMESQSISNIRQLAVANLTYAAENGRFVRHANDADTKRWFGSRVNSQQAWKPTGGYLGDLLEGGTVRYCPVLEDMFAGNSSLKGANDFDKASGGYGYNEDYIGKKPSYKSDQLSSSGGSTTPELGATRPKPGQGEETTLFSAPGELTSNLADPSRVVMFASSAIAQSDGIVEYSATRPYFPLNDTGGTLAGNEWDPTTHFRFKGRALVAWADGHVTFEKPNGKVGGSVYGGDNTRQKVGWFGPVDNNGLWNPFYGEGIGWR